MTADALATDDCWTCRSNTGIRRLSPGAPIYEGTHWLVEHAYPVGLLGWLVIVLRRHAAALHELVADEFHELARIQATLVPLLATTLHSEKEYVACFAEAEHFRHVHFHVVPVQPGTPGSLRGCGSLALLKVGEAEAVAAAEVQAFCRALHDEMARRLR
jgi:diadenosine tetraphosphate (Ap4A) HIT family hydrolase